MVGLTSNLRFSPLHAAVLAAALLWLVAACDKGAKDDDGDESDGQVRADSAVPDTASPPDGEGLDGPGALDSARPSELAETAAGDGSSTTGPLPANPKPYSGGTCPQFVQGKNSIVAAGRNRSFELYLPPGGGQGAACVFVWHGNGDTGKNIADFFGGKYLAEKQNAIVVGPSSCCDDGINDCCDMLMTWNFGEFSKKEADLALFDDMLSCIDKQFNIDNTRVYSTGFSSGSLWTTYLLLHRSDYFAAVSIFSGGTGTVFPYATPAVKVPALLAWGGENDTYMNMVSFHDMTLDLAANLLADGHFIVECNHGPYANPGSGHTIPMSGPTWGTAFLFAHVFGQPSPVQAGGLSAPYPEYCLIPPAR
jgi:predicted esterase